MEGSTRPNAIIEHARSQCNVNQWREKISLNYNKRANSKHWIIIIIFSSFIFSFADYFSLLFAGTVWCRALFWNCSVGLVSLSFNFRLNNIDIINYYTLKGRHLLLLRFMLLLLLWWLLLLCTVFILANWHRR